MKKNMKMTLSIRKEEATKKTSIQNIMNTLLMNQKPPNISRTNKILSPIKPTR